MSRRFAYLVLPAANRVYAEATPALSRAELAVFAERVLSGKVTDVEEATIGGATYICFTATDLTERDLGFLGNLSSIFALFELVDDGELLRPLPLTSWDHYDDDLITIQKYSGKTNEHFTKLLLNVTALAARWAPELPERRPHVFDPLCGRGTTLNQALMYGWNATGTDIDDKGFEAYGGFLRTWCRHKRLKHTAETTPVRRDRKVLGRQLSVTLAPTKQAYRAGDTQSVRMVNVDTRQARAVFKAGSFDLVVVDAPYGVQHASRSGPRGSSSSASSASSGSSGPGSARPLSRSPLALLGEAVPIWTELLRSGGAVGLAWNTQVANRAETAQLLREAGLQVLDESPYTDFEHRVDSSVLRDILVARRP